MLDRVSVPTDNIYKFIALFSLVMVIFFAWQVLSINTMTNTIVFQNYPEVEELRSKEVRSRAQEARLAVLDRQIEVATEDRKNFNYLLGGAMGLAVCGLFYGFHAWHKEIQPLADAQNKAQLEILHLQIEKLKLENKKLSDSLKTIEIPPTALHPAQPRILTQVVRALLRLGENRPD